MSDFMESRALLYALRADSWREIKIELEAIFLPNDKGVYCKGVYYWLNKGVPGSKKTVLSFDMSEEVFHSIAIPDHIQKEIGNLRGPTTGNDSIVFFFLLKNSWNSTSFEVWMMVRNREGVPRWSKNLTVRSLVCIYAPLTFWKDDELLMETRDGRVVTYNLHNQKFRQLPT
ncbi:hypothetical protein TIFTF001_011215 [Ficus carica]|uniref:F-box associated beta-propeller type 1 domain-containing protein n=1 Tax=Ficus carica TaxID=3494 RepID=A0AA88DHU5_FICCA|nr:hypothetical protein TIFTF001_011215 [Ficus carica]